MPSIARIARQILQGRTLYRSLFNEAVAEHCNTLHGQVLDLAGGRHASYLGYLPSAARVTGTDLTPASADLPVDFNAPLPFPDGSFDALLFFNAIYIVKNRQLLYREMHRVLKPGGAVYIASPFLAAEMPEPDDFCRLTHQGLTTELEPFFQIEKTVRIGERFTVTANLLWPFWYFNIVRLLAAAVSLFLDRLIPSKITTLHPAPLGYFCINRKTDI